MGYIHSIQLNDNSTYLIEPVLYAAASGTTTALTANISNFELVAGTNVNIKVGTVDADATLNVNDIGAKEIRYNNENIKVNQLKANHIYTFVYDGTYWQVVGDIDTDTWRGIQDNLTSDSTTDSLSAKQGKVLKGLIDAMDASTPAADGNATAFIDSITQTDGKITSITKKNIPTASTSTPGIIKIGTTANDAAAGNHTHSYNDLTNKINEDIFVKKRALSISTDVELVKLLPGMYDHTSNMNKTLPTSYGTVLNIHGNYKYGSLIAAETDNVMYYRTYYYDTDDSWQWRGEWQTIAHAAQSTSNIGSATQPVYMTAAGVITAGTALKDLAYISKGSGTTKFLREDGTWQTALTSHQSLAAYAPLASPALTGTPTAPTAANGTSTTQIATTEFVNNTLSYVNAMRFKGTLGTGGTVTALPASHEAGDTYRVITAGTWAGEDCQVGTLIICTTDGTTANDAHWACVGTNEDGTMIGPESSTDNAIARFDGATGRIIQDSKVTIDDNGCITLTHIDGKSKELSIQYGSTIDYWWGVGTGNANYGLYDSKAAKWILSAGAANTWTFDGNAATATTATNLANNPSIQASTSNANQITITAGGKTSNAFTVPYATASTYAKYLYPFSDGTNVSSTTNIQILQAIQNSDATPRLVPIGARLLHGHTEVGFGYFYPKNSLYGGWYIASYGGPSYVAVTNGTWETYWFLTSKNTAAGTNNAATLAWNTTYTIAKINGTDIKFTTMAQPSYAFTDLTAHPTTLSGYGITDAASSSHSHTLKIGNKSLSVSTSEQEWTVHGILYNTNIIQQSTSWDIITPGIYAVTNGSHDGSGHPGSTTGQTAPYPYGHLIVTRASSYGAAQFYISHIASGPKQANRGIRYRSGWNVDNTGKTEAERWQEWATILDDKNFNLYAPTLTGTGASGTWGISITGSSASCTGNAATATTATTATADTEGRNFIDTYAKEYVQIIDLTGDDSTLWYPVTIIIPAQGLRRVSCVTQLNSHSKPNWASHNNGYTAVVEMLVTAAGWGTTSALSICLTDNQLWLNDGEPKPIGFSQFNNSSRATFWCRGGAKYRLLTDFFETWAVYKTDTTVSSQTIGPKTTNPGIHFSKSTITATLNGNANTATAANLTSTANAVAYYTNTTGTFGSKASANGALYATSANGALQWGTLPIAQGGTGVVSFTKNQVILSDNTNGTTGLTSRAYSDSTSAEALSNTSINFVTERDVYFGLPTLNNAHNYTSSSTYYAPTAGGTAGHVLIGAGATTAPAWYGGTVMSGTAAASWITAFNGTTDATATNAAAVTIAGGLGVAKKLHVGDTATVPDLTIGSTNEYGDAYTPIYWHEGVPTVVTLTQQCAFTINSGMSGVKLSHAAITANSYVTQIVVTSGEANLNSAISWTSASGYIELTCSSTVSGDVTGYIMISRGGEITATATDIT